MYWDEIKVVPKAGKFFGRPFNMKRGVTQGDPVSRTMFTILVDAVVRLVLLEVCVPQEEPHGFEWAAGKHIIYFCADDGHIAGRNPIWLQIILTAMVRMFERVGLQTNLIKTNSMVFTPGFIWDRSELRCTSIELRERNPPFGRGI